jgi:hypothetical protein
MQHGRKTNMNRRQQRPTASFAARSKPWSSNATRPEPKGSHNAQRNYERYLELARAEEHSRGRKLLPARRTLFQVDVLGQRSDIGDFATTTAVIKCCKAELREAALRELNVSENSFDFGWIDAIAQTGRHDWYEPLRRRMRAKSQICGAGPSGGISRSAFGPPTFLEGKPCGKPRSLQQQSASFQSDATRALQADRRPEDGADCAAPAPRSVLICRYRGISLI